MKSYLTHAVGMQQNTCIVGCIPSGCGWWVGHRFLHSHRTLLGRTIDVETSKP